MNTEAPCVLVTQPVDLTLKSDKQGKECKLKVFWKTTRFWTSADIADFQAKAPDIADRLRTEQYWNKDGEIGTSTFTCEDFAIRLLCEYAASRGLPVKLTTGVRTYKNMEFYVASEHDRYSSNVYGFSHMVMLTYGAPDMQRIGVNTVAVHTIEELMPGDILAQEGDNKDGRAHHIQVVVSLASDMINIYQGNSGAANRTSLLYRIIGKNPADPNDDSYTGKFIETGHFAKSENGWNYHNNKSGQSEKDFLKIFGKYRWNFLEFNK